MKMPKAPAAKAAKVAKVALPHPRHTVPKPHIRARKLKPVAPGAFPTAAAAFPTPAGPPGPGAAMDATPEGMPGGASPGMMGE